MGHLIFDLTLCDTARNKKIANVGQMSLPLLLLTQETTHKRGKNVVTFNALLLYHDRLHTTATITTTYLLHYARYVVFTILSITAEVELRTTYDCCCFLKRY